MGATYAGAMTARKPGDVSWESWIESQIREARERGEFDNLPGTGKPLAEIDGPPDELWWLKKLVKREKISVTPPTMALRKAREDLLAGIGTQRSEADVRGLVAALNERIREVNSKATSGPPSTVMPLDGDRVVELWRNRRAAEA